MVWPDLRPNIRLCWGGRIMPPTSYLLYMSGWGAPCFWRWRSAKDMNGPKYRNLRSSRKPGMWHSDSSKGHIGVKIISSIQVPSLKTQTYFTVSVPVCFEKFATCTFSLCPSPHPSFFFFPISVFVRVCVPNNCITCVFSHPLCCSSCCPGAWSGPVKSERNYN